MTARIETPGLEHWRGDEDDYGEPMICNRHVDAEYPSTSSAAMASAGWRGVPTTCSTWADWHEDCNRTD